MFFIILCCYQPNLEYLQAQLASIRAQTDRDFHCLLQDDASPPEWSAQIEALLAAACPGDARFSFRRNPVRLGVFHNFEKGLYQTPAQAQYICYCDQDDLWLPHKLARQRAVLQDATVSLCHTDLELIDGQDQTLHASCFAFENRNVEDYSLPQLILRNSVTGCTLAFRATLLPQLLPFPRQGLTPRFHHDHFTVLTAAQKGRIVTLLEPLVRYRQHGNNVLGAAVATSRKLAELAHLPPLLATPSAHLAALATEWTRRLSWIELLLDRAPAQPHPAARLDVLVDWTQRKAGSAYLFKFALPHLFRPDDPLAPVMLPVLLGKLTHGVRGAGRRLGQLVRRPLNRLQQAVDRLDPLPVHPADREQDLG